MAADRSTTQFTGFLVPLALTVDDVVEADSTYTQDDPQPSDDVVPAADSYRLSLEASGSQEATTYVLATRRGGHVRPGGAGYTWRKSTDASDRERGWDPPSVVSDYARLRWAAAAVGVSSHPHAVRLIDGQVLVAAYESYLVGTASYRVTLYMLDYDGTITSATAYTSATAPSTRIDSSWHPALAMLADGRVRLGHIVEDTNAEEAQWRVYDVDVSDPTAITVSTVSSFSLNVPIDTDTGASDNGSTVLRARWAHSEGDDLLLFWLRPVDTSLSHQHGYAQYQSTSGGLRFTRIELATKDADADADPGTWGYPDLIAYRGGFVVHYSSSVDATQQIMLPDAGTPISQQTGVEVQAFASATHAALHSSTKYFETGDRALWAEPGGTLHATIRDYSSSRGAVLLARSVNGGLTWEAYGTGLASSDNAWHASGVSGLYPSGFSACAGHGRSYVISNHTAPTSTTYQGSLSIWSLGGSSTVTMPANTEFAYDEGRCVWSHTGVPDELPGNAGWTKTAAGTSSEALTNGDLDTSTTSGQLFYTQTLTISTLAQGVTGNFVLKQASGGSTGTMISGVTARIETSTVSYDLQIRTQYSPARIEVHDPNAGTTLLAGVTVDWSTFYEVRFELRSSSAQVFYRVHDGHPDREWIQLASTTGLTSAGSGSGTTGTIKFGPSFVGGDTSRVCWYRWSFSDDEEAGRRTLPYTNPTDTWPRDYAGVDSTGSYVDAGLHISAVAGPSAAGESYTAAPRYPYPLRNVFWQHAASPQRYWRSTAGTSTAAAVSLSVALSSVAGQETRLPPLLAVHLSGLRGLRTGDVLKRTGGSYSSLGTFDLSWSFSFTRSGDTALVGGSDTTGEFFHLDECRDWWIRLDDGAGTVVWRRVSANTEGVLAGASSSRRLQLSLADVVSGDPASGTAQLCPAAAVLLYNLTGTPTADRLKITLDAGDAPDNRHQLGVLDIGEVVLPGRAISDGNRITTIARTTRFELPDGIDDARNQGPESREFEAGWMEMLPATNTRGLSANPGVLYATTAGSRQPAGVPHAAAFTLEGLLRRCRGAERPVVWFPVLTQHTSGGVIILRRRNDFIRARITGNVVRRRVIEDTWRVESIALTEVV